MCPVAVAYITELSDKKQPIKVQYMDGSEIQIDDRINRSVVQNEYESIKLLRQESVVYKKRHSVSSTEFHSRYNFRS